LTSHETTILDTTTASDGTERIPRESSTSSFINLDELRTDETITEEKKETTILTTSNKEIDEEKSTEKPKEEEHEAKEDVHEEEDGKEEKGSNKGT
jgi:hypothetical protein